MRQSKTDGILTKDLLQSSEYAINEFIKKLEENEFKIDEVYQKHDIHDHNLVDVPSREPEAKLTFDFIKGARKVIFDTYIELEDAAPVLSAGGGGAASLYPTRQYQRSIWNARFSIAIRLLNLSLGTGMHSSKLLCHFGRIVKPN